MERDAGARAVLIAAMSSGQGKTSVTAALARKLLRQGLRVRVFKCGPDFIDPMLLERASGAPVHTLDLWMVGVDECRRRLHDAAREADAILIEGVMGLYDGSPSAADLAREFGVPVLAVIDASAMAQTAGAVARGLRDYGPVQLAGVVANRIASEGHAGMVASSLHDIPLLGWLARQDAPLPERHLGLVLPGEVEGLDALLDKLADGLHFNEDAWNALPLMAQSAPEWQEVERLLDGRTVAIARDPAFCFLYPANLELLERMGARLRYFSPLRDEAVPIDADAVFLPGGYPELHCAALTRAANWQASIRAAHARGVPILAECGGMMVLADGLTDQDGQRWPMVGLLPGEVHMQPRLAGLGAHAMPTEQGPVRGHSFHYSRLETAAPAQAHTVKTGNGAQGEAVYRIGSLTASYFHAYFPSNPPAVAALLGAGKP
ncbi:MAG: cobyrinate a,c-diamide synthase [Janthinobacterium lividum]